MAQLARQWARAVRAAVWPKLKALAASEGHQAPANGHSVKLPKLPPWPGLGPLSSKVAARVSRHVSLELERILPKKKSSTRLDARRKPTEQDLVADWRKDLVARVKTVEESEHARLERMFATATRYGEAELSDRLERQFELCGWSADRLARSHTAALTAKLTEHRMTEAGIEEYVWTTMGDERVSEAHDELEGQTFRFDDPPTDSDGNTGNPGDIRPNCRCTAYPVMTTLDAGEEE